MPVAQRVQSALKPRPAVHHVVRQRPVPAASAPKILAAVPCTPVMAAKVAGIGMSSPLVSALEQSSIAQGVGGPASAGGGFGSGNDNNSGFSPIGFGATGRGGFAGGGGGGGMQPQTGGNPGQGPVPVTSPAPEVTTWAMMATGIGAIGGTLRYRRRQPRAV